MADFGFTTQFLNSVPEIKTLVARATSGAWEMDRFLEALKSTTWWKKQTDAQRRYQVQVVENPGEIGNQIDRQAAAIRRMLTSMGMTFASGYIINLARDAVRNGWTETELRFAVGQKYARGGVGSEYGLIGQTNVQVDRIAGDYGVKVTSSARNNIIRNVLNGTLTVADYGQFFRSLAKRQYSAVADMLDAGYTTRQILDPYLQTAAQELGVNPATLNISDAKWNRPITYRGEKPAAGAKPQEMTMDEWTRTLRTKSEYGFDYSQNAQKQASQFASQLMTLMGAR